MRFARVGYELIEVPETWAEGEKMIASAMAYHEGRGGNTSLKSVLGRVAYGLFGEKFLAADPTQALAFLVKRICERKGAGLV